MSIVPTEITLTEHPTWLTAIGDEYDAPTLRRPLADIISEGCIDSESYYVSQADTPGMSVWVGALGVSFGPGPAELLNVAYVNGTSAEDQGIYRVRYFGAPNVLTVAANSSGLPRIDSVFLEVRDAQHSGASNDARVRIISGTPTSGATLTNRNGAPSTPPNCLLLGDVIVASGATAITNTEIADRRVRAVVGNGNIVRPKVRLRRTSAAAMTSGISYNIQWTNQDEDTDDQWDSGTPSVITVNTPGSYLVSVSTTTEANVNGQRSLVVTTDPAGSQVITGDYRRPLTAGDQVNNLTTVLQCQKGDQIRFWLYQDSGATLSLRADVPYNPCRVTITYLGR